MLGSLTPAREIYIALDGESALNSSLVYACSEQGRRYGMEIHFVQGPEERYNYRIAVSVRESRTRQGAGIDLTATVMDPGSNVLFSIKSSGRTARAAVNGLARNLVRRLAQTASIARSGGDDSRAGLYSPRILIPASASESPIMTTTVVQPARL